MLNGKLSLYKCTQCGTEFKTKPRYMIHLERKRPCGIVSDDYILDQAKIHLANAIEDYDKQKSLEEIINSS